jgi:hypothetical protein
MNLFFLSKTLCNQLFYPFLNNYPPMRRKLVVGLKNDI